MFLAHYNELAQDININMEKHWVEVTKQNSKDIAEIKSDIKTIKDNHLHHIEIDMKRQSKAIEKVDNRIWWVLGILVVSVVAGMVQPWLN